MKLPKELNKICRVCKQLRSKHETWAATGEYAENVVCPTANMDKEGRYRDLRWYQPMTNLEYLEYKAQQNETTL